MSVETRHQSFAESIRKNGDTFLHPELISRQNRIKDTIASQLSSKKHDAYSSGLAHRYPSLLPESADQDLLVTPFDSFEGYSVGIPRDELLEGWRKQREFNLSLANHPDRIAAMKRLEDHGFTPPKKIDGVIDNIIKRGEIPQLSDLAHNIDVKMMEEEKPHSPTQVHRTELLENGPFSFVGRKARSFVGLGAMPDINGSVLALETAAKMHALSEVPEVGLFSDPQKQAMLAKAVLERLTIDDPILEGRSEEEKQYIVDHWRSNVVGVLEVAPEKALRRADLLRNVGIKSFRPYGHSVGTDIIKTTKLLRSEFGKDVEIFSSQITNLGIALECEQAGADALIGGVGSGGRCTTAELSQLTPSNAVLAWKLRGEIGIPFIGEGGAVDEIVISILAGMSGVNGSGSIGGGTFEAPGGMFFMQKDGKFYKPYGGEASDRTKWLSGRTFPTGLPYFSEGEQSLKELVIFEESMTQKFLYHWSRIVLGAVILGINEKERTIEAMQSISPSPLFEKSPTTEYLQRTH